MHYGAIVYLVICLIIGLAGTNKKMGFYGYFFASIVLTPLIGGLLVLVSESRKKQ